MNKIYLIVVSSLLLFFCFLTPVKAIEVEDVMGSSYLLVDDQVDCEGIFGDPGTEGSFAHFLQQIFNVFKYLAPSLVIVLTIVDFIKAAASDDKDALLKASKKAGTRIVLAISLFFLPVLINFLFDKLGWYGTCGLG